MSHVVTNHTFRLHKTVFGLRSLTNGKLRVMTRGQYVLEQTSLKPSSRIKHKSNETGTATAVGRRTRDFPLPCTRLTNHTPSDTIEINFIFEWKMERKYIWGLKQEQNRVLNLATRAVIVVGTSGNKSANAAHAQISLCRSTSNALPCYHETKRIHLNNIHILKHSHS